MRVTCLLQRGRAPAACRARNRVARSLRFFLRARPRRLVINPLCRRWCVYEAGGPQSVFCSRGDAGGGGPAGRHRRARTAESCPTPGASWVGVPKAPPLGVAGACGARWERGQRQGAENPARGGLRRPGFLSPCSPVPRRPVSLLLLSTSWPQSGCKRSRGFHGKRKRKAQASHICLPLRIRKKKGSSSESSPTDLPLGHLLSEGPGSQRTKNTCSPSFRA